MLNKELVGTPTMTPVGWDSTATPVRSAASIGCMTAADIQAAIEQLHTVEANRTWE
jgi:hypothetical protein